MIHLIKHQELGLEMFTVLYYDGEGRWFRPSFTSEGFARRYIAQKFPDYVFPIELKEAKQPLFTHNTYSNEYIPFHVIGNK